MSAPTKVTKVTKVTKNTKIIWFVRCGNIARMGPYATMLQAWDALTGLDGNPVTQSCVWPEAESKEKTKRGTKKKSGTQPA